MLQTGRSRVRDETLPALLGPGVYSAYNNWVSEAKKKKKKIPPLPDFRRSRGSGTRSTHPREYNSGATWKKTNGSGVEIWEYGCKDPLCWPRNTLSPRKLALTSPTSGGRSVVVRSRTKSHGVWLFFCFLIFQAKGISCSVSAMWSKTLRGEVNNYPQCTCICIYSYVGSTVVLRSISMRGFRFSISAQVWYSNISLASNAKRVKLYKCLTMIIKHYTIKTCGGGWNYSLTPCPRR
jgi:hypothetical protein